MKYLQDHMSAKRSVIFRFSRSLFLSPFYIIGVRASVKFETNMAAPDTCPEAYYQPVSIIKPVWVRV